MSVLAIAPIALVLAALGVPVAFALFAGGIVYFLTADGLPFSVYLQRVTSELDSFPLLAIPLFILAGNLMNHTGIAERTFNAALAAFGRARGSLTHVNVASSMIVAGMSGVAQADAAGLGAIEIRAMRNQGYRPAFAAAVTAASAIIGPLIPPSVIMIVYAVTAQVSVGDLFLAGLVAGLAMMAVIAVLARRRPEEFPVSGDMTRADKRAAYIAAIPALIAPAILVAGLLTGFATPTELGALAVVYSAGYGVMAGALTRARFIHALQQTVQTCGVVLLIVAAAILIGWIIAVNNVPFAIADAILATSQEKWVVLLILNIILLIVGCFVETTAILLIGLPALLPLAAQIGVDPIHLGLIIIFNLLLGGLTPPFGVLPFIMMHIAKVSPGAIVKAMLPFYVVLFAMLLLITYWPEPWLFLPRYF